MASPPPAAAPTVLVVDDEDSVRESMRRVLRGTCRVLEAGDAATALETLRRHAVDVVLLDVRLPDAHGVELLGSIRATDDSVEVILVTAVREVRAAVEAMKLGAYDYLTKPFDVDELRTQVGRAVERRALHRALLAFRGELREAQGFEAIVGSHPSMRRIYETLFPIRQFAALKPYPRINGTNVIGLAGDLVRTRALIREAESGMTLGPFHDFFFAPRECRPLLARLRRNPARAALTPDQVAHFFAGHGPDAATSLALATGLVSAGRERLTA